MDKSEKLRLDQWVEETVYAYLEKAKHQKQLSATDAATLAPFIQMYQAIQLKNVYDELQSLWRLLIDGEASLSIKTTFDGIDVNIKEMPKDEPPPPKKRTPNPVNPKT